jgi:hypothetical protein
VSFKVNDGEVFCDGLVSEDSLFWLGFGEVWIE